MQKLKRTEEKLKLGGTMDKFLKKDDNENKETRVDLQDISTEIASCSSSAGGLLMDIEEEEYSSSIADQSEKAKEEGNETTPSEEGGEATQDTQATDILTPDDPKYASSTSSSDWEEDLENVAAFFTVNREDRTE
ncbi:hypothetical protein NQ314_013935 [Rhamnusium bicolor]|uniref:Uncharacterized protein n=1 Tax=Rhamnusium bicolor TaxID=1586634 RepID=A0AAV8X577_9CUCU|nr:hypothetical protein NQ314_013935 [Rhamnusium bicolor]